MINQADPASIIMEDNPIPANQPRMAPAIFTKGFP